MTKRWLAAERARTRRPITAGEVPGLEALGVKLRRLREDAAQLTRPALSVRAEISVRQIEQISPHTVSERSFLPCPLP